MKCKPETPPPDKIELYADCLNELFEYAEEIFQNIKPKMSASVPMGERELVFGKHGKRWRILVSQPEIERDGSDPNSTPTPLSDQPLVLRVEASHYIPKLHDAILVKQVALSKSLYEAISKLEAYLDSINAG
jgi:hypothetical protein